MDLFQRFALGEIDAFETLVRQSQGDIYAWIVRIVRVLFLASEDSAYINAVELMVDGGATGAPWGVHVSKLNATCFWWRDLQCLPD